MLRSMWTAASGMKAQQFNIDTISNNLANVNTTGFKTNRAEFKDLFYSNMKRSNRVDDAGRPVNLEVGHGTMPVATKRKFTTGSFLHTEGECDLALNGDGFFVIDLGDGQLRYTRDGSFKLSSDGQGAALVTSEGYYVMDDGDSPIEFGDGFTDIIIDERGRIFTRNEGDEEANEVGRLKLVKFANPEGLHIEGGNLYRVSDSSGEAIEIDEDNVDTMVVQGYLEASNVQIVDEMVRMITAQRAYEINSKSITTSDEMLQIANNLKR